jgi:hypothetical protein
VAIVDVDVARTVDPAALKDAPQVTPHRPQRLGGPRPRREPAIR